jgi:hypothetical protein
LYRRSLNENHPEKILGRHLNPRMIRQEDNKVNMVFGSKLKVVGAPPINSP